MSERFFLTTFKNSAKVRLNQPSKEAEMRQEKIKTISTARKTYEAAKDQYWQETTSGKAYRLWLDNEEGLKLLKSIPSARVFLVIPF